jgi:hypothetical protein
MELDLAKLADARAKELMERAKAGMRRWKPYIDVLEAHYKSQGKELQEYQKANIAQCCDNFVDLQVVGRRTGDVNETTYSSAIAFARQMLPTIPALLPSLVSEEVSIVQAIDRPQAQVYYMNIVAGTTKGAVTSGDDLIDAQTGHASDKAHRYFASDYVIGEQVGTGDGSTTVFNGHTCAYFPVVSINDGPDASVNSTSSQSGGNCNVYYTITGVQYTANDANADGILTGTGLSSGSVNLTTGVVHLTFSTAPDNTTNITMDYRYNVEQDNSAIGELNLQVNSSNVDAQVFPLKLQYTVFSAINLQKIHGLVLADEGMKFATQEIRFAIDQVVLNACRTASLSTGGATQALTFNASVGTGQEWIWKMHEIKKYFSMASINIFQKTLRATGNVIVCGMSVISIIEQLQDFKPAAGLGTKPPAGPYVAGTLGNRLIIANPFFANTEYVMLFRGDNYLFAGLIFAPYVPLYSTDPVTLANLTTQRGFFSQAAIKRINDGMFCYGQISNYS